MFRCFHNFFTKRFSRYYQDALLPLLKEGYPTPFNSLRQLMHLVAAHAYDSTKLPDMHWNQQRDTLSVKGFPLKISLVPEMAQSLCEKAESLLERLLLGVAKDAFNHVIDVALNPSNPSTWPVDPLRNTDHGFSFVHSPDNPFFPYLRMVLEHIHSDPSVFDTYHFIDNQGRLVHKPGTFPAHHKYLAYPLLGSIRAYLNLHHEFIDVLMVLAHVATPGVARGSELGPLRSTNSIDGPRNFFFLAGSCAIICQYNKTRSITGKDDFVAHFLPKAVSRLFIYLIGPIREVVAALSRIVSPDSHLVYQTYLYVVNGKTVDSAAFSNVLRAYTLEYLRVPLTLAPFRQAVKALLRNVLHYHEELESDDDAIDACFGHSSFVGNSRYGLVYDDLPGLTENVYVGALRLASVYHSWLGMASSPPPPNPQSVVKSLPLERLVSRIENALPSLEAFRDQHLTDLTAVENRIIEKCLPMVQDTILATLSRQVPWSSYLRLPPPLSFPQEEILIHQSRIGYLRTLFKRQDVYFKSLQQGEAIEVVSRRHPHALVVLPTGGGKSAVYQAPCFSGEKGFRVILVPYISLMEQALLDASEKGIPHAVWSSSNLDIDVFTVKLVFAAVEQVSKERFREWLRVSFHTGYLNGIVIDEAHDILLSRNFRETFCQFTCLGNIGCQIVLLSATISPSLEPNLWRVCLLFYFCISATQSCSRLVSIPSAILFTSSAGLQHVQTFSSWSRGYTKTCYNPSLFAFSSATPFCLPLIVASSTVKLLKMRPFLRTSSMPLSILAPWMMMQSLCRCVLGYLGDHDGFVRHLLLLKGSIMDMLLMSCIIAFRNISLYTLNNLVVLQDVAMLSVFPT